MYRMLLSCYCLTFVSRVLGCYCVRYVSKCYRVDNGPLNFFTVGLVLLIVLRCS